MACRCCCGWQWWKGELERRYLLYRARCLHDAHTTHQHTPTAPVPALLKGRVAAGHALPSVETAPQQSQAGASGQGRASTEAAHADEERHAVLQYVVTQLNEQLFTELVKGFHVPM